MITPDFAGIPEELRDYDQWIVWKFETREGQEKPTKVPYVPSLGNATRASHSNPDTWGSFTEARAVYLKSDQYDGIGFVFSADDPFCGVDFDNVVDPDSTTILPEAEDMVVALSSYTERSPSGTGLHAILAGVKPERGFRTGFVEMYDRDRYFTITGVDLGPGYRWPIEDRQTELETLHGSLFPPEPERKPVERTDLEMRDQQVLDLIEQATNADKFRALYHHGDLSSYAQDESRADLALCAMIAFYTQDPAQVDALYRGSALMRPKWDKKRGAGTYGSKTIELAISNLKDTYTPPKPAAPADAPPGREGEPQQVVYASPPSEATNGTRRIDASTHPATPNGPRKEALQTKPMPFPVSAMPARCKELIEQGSKSLCCPPEFIAFPMLAAISSAIGTTRRLQINRSWTEYPAVFLSIVAYPGSMKSPAAKIGNRPVYQLQKKYEAEYLKAKDEHEAELRQYEVDKREAAKDNRAAPPPPQEPVMRRTVAGDTTVEGMAPILKGNPRGLYIHRDELAGWVRSMDQYRSGGKGADTELWLSVWGNEAWVIDRKGKQDPVFIDTPFVSLFGGMTPLRLGELGNPMEDGLMERFLFGYPEARKYRYNHNSTTPEAEGAYANLYNTLADLKHDDGEPKIVTLTEDADAMFGELVNQLAEESEAPGFPRKLDSVWSKLRGYTGRLCLIMAVARQASASGAGGMEPALKVIPDDVLKAGQLLDYFKSHARRVFSTAQDADPEDVFIADVADFLEEHHQGSWTGQASTLLALLQEYGMENLPKSPKGLSQKLQRVANASQGLFFTRDHDDRHTSRALTITTRDPSEDASHPSMRRESEESANGTTLNTTERDA